MAGIELSRKLPILLKPKTECHFPGEDRSKDACPASQALGGRQGVILEIWTQDKGGSAGTFVRKVRAREDPHTKAVEAPPALHAWEFDQDCRGNCFGTTPNGRKESILNTSPTNSTTTQFLCKTLSSAHNGLGESMAAPHQALTPFNETAACAAAQLMACTAVHHRMQGVFMHPLNSHADALMHGIDNVFNVLKEYNLCIPKPKLVDKTMSTNSNEHEHFLTHREADKSHYSCRREQFTLASMEPSSHYPTKKGGWKLANTQNTIDKSFVIGFIRKSTKSNKRPCAPLYNHGFDLWDLTNIWRINMLAAEERLVGSYATLSRRSDASACKRLHAREHTCSHAQERAHTNALCCCLTTAHTHAHTRTHTLRVAADTRTHTHTHTPCVAA
eukprot:1157375-Pelagomonas_calceolata.AAC.17